MELDAYLKDRAAAVDRALGQWLPPERTRPTTLHRAIRYSMFAGGKRLRPILCIAAAECCGGSADDAMPAAAAVECIHTYSLIHDDLPCMDDDDFRRGNPTSHKVFGEAVAVLAGDALQAAAFEILASAPGNRRYPAAAMVAELAKASGSRFLVAGQVADLEGEGKNLGIDEVRFIHRTKTAALLTCAVRLGAMGAGATPARLDALTTFAQSLGLAFQVIDDILDVTGTDGKLGKTAGKDAASGKGTYPAAIGLDASRRAAAKLTSRALRSLDTFGSRANRLREIAGRLLSRES
jgi:geranylgeranyl diphosphate synthase type II